MNAVPILPESAPFTPTQRAWLNGFFAGLMNRVAGGGGSSPAAASASATAETPASADAAEEFPWHDAALSLDERMMLAEGKPVARQLMAAMAQLDCGACGYVCQSYSEAIAAGVEKDLSKCAPGGKDTSRKLKELVARTAGVGGANAVVLPGEIKVSRTGVNGHAKPQPGVYSRLHPCVAPIIKAEALNRAGSAKDTRLVTFDLTGTNLKYEVGDALGVYPENCPDVVQWLLDALDAVGTEKVSAPDGALVPLREALTRHYAVTKPSERLVELLAECAKGRMDQDGLRLLADENGPGVPEGTEVLDLLLQFPSARPEPEQFVSALTPMQPRLYSISSSQRAVPNEVHLTVGVVRFVNPRGRQCKGVASTYLAERLKPGDKCRVFVQTSHGFRLPADGNVPMIMVGPGTGIAPFRAFLQERQATGAKGKNWLFFGDQRKEFDLLYEQELLGYQQSGVLTSLDLAFSRDQAEKVYVQTRMMQRAGEIWAWLQQGAHFYVCGDAKRMAKDVDDALKAIVVQQGGLSADDAKAYVADMAKAKRYQRDVY
jgi:sulfite reductase (NADPH) flavoprotein alpha-component